MTDETLRNLPAMPPWRRNVATGILVLAALGALYAFTVAVATVRTAGPETLVVASLLVGGYRNWARLRPPAPERSV